MRTGDKKGRYFVTAGKRRRRALLLLLEQGDIQKNHAVDCKVRDGEDATEISLTAIPDIAARFGTTDIIVRRRLALAKGQAGSSRTC